MDEGGKARVGFFSPADTFDAIRGAAPRFRHRPHLSGSKMNGAANPALRVARMPTNWLAPAGGCQRQKLRGAPTSAGNWHKTPSGAWIFPRPWQRKFREVRRIAHTKGAFLRHPWHNLIRRRKVPSKLKRIKSRRGDLEVADNESDWRCVNRTNRLEIAADGSTSSAIESAARRRSAGLDPTGRRSQVVELQTATMDNRRRRTGRWRTHQSRLMAAPTHVSS